MMKQKNIFQTKLSGYCMMEAVVSSVIFMTVFLIGMSVLTRLAGHGTVDARRMVIELELQKQRKKIVADELVPTRQQLAYAWGEIRMNVAPYRGKVFVIELEATDKEQRRLLFYRFLQANTVASL